jgi:hypothetical protein
MNEKNKAPQSALNSQQSTSGEERERERKKRERASDMSVHVGRAKFIELELPLSAVQNVNIRRENERFATL